MTLLITVAGHDYALSCSDMRISVQSGKRFTSIDEKFNKHIVFHSDGLTADISYTGLARWSDSGKIVKVYDIISESLAKSCSSSLAFGSLSLNLTIDLLAALERLRRIHRMENSIIELHIIGYHKAVPWPFIGVISTFRLDAPWSSKTELEWEYHFDGVHFYFKVAETPEVIFGGTDTTVRSSEKERFRNLVIAGADAFNVSRMASKQIEQASKRSTAIGPRSVSIVLPREGFLDTNLWDKQGTGLVGFLPRIIFPNGASLGPSEFPVSLSLLSEGHLPKNSLFFKSVVSAEYKRRLRRLIFQHQKGPAIPGLMGLIGLALYGKVPEGYTDFGLGH
ncbi:hypothetical protein [Nitrosomonas ureae]|uniref:Uncharacterized protein n=1 Tax=Nitrosomonas ureae TaxID=44577 RepID=A0A1H5W9D1_9PROT|nr:hypothetical protein [Nitrosomonas ureae]SEF95801.1 hypothetical protein SAMN05216334_11716 [Nitrosomonas ureae]